MVRGHLRKGESLLVYSGAEGVGQSAIAVALDAGCTVYTTASTQEQRNVLKQRFPQLKDSHIADFRTNAFEQSIIRVTKGHGVDMVVYTSSEERQQVSARCLSKHGRILDLTNDASLGKKNLEIPVYVNDRIFSEQCLNSGFQQI